MKLADDLLSATRYALMMRRFAAIEPSQKNFPLNPLGGAGGWMGT